MATKSGDKGLHDWFNKSSGKDPKTGKKVSGWRQLGGKFAGAPCAKQPGQKTKPKCGSSKMARNLSDKEEESAFRRKNRKDPNPNRSGAPINVATEKKKKLNDSFSNWRNDIQFDEGRYRGGGGLRPNDKIRMLDGSLKSLNDLDAKFKKKDDDTKPLQKNSVELEGDVIDEEGKKDACYKKVKANSKVWPSAYASGRLVQCRKKGAANWNTKKEGYQYSTSWRDDYEPTDYETIDIIKPEPIKSEVLDEKKNGGDNDPCWDTHKQVGMKKKGGKMVPNCVPKEEYSNWRDEIEEGAAWTKKSGKSESGGLNEKGRKSYERENPGSDLKAPSKKVGNPRRKSFCARMKGMKKKLTSSKTANDPDSRINKSLRAWNC